jgi:hypothetical protein
MRFLVRLELKEMAHGNSWIQPTRAIYDAVHQAMEEAGFSRQIVGVTTNNVQKTWHLPPAEYWIEADSMAANIRTYVYNMVRAIWAEAVVFVVRFDDWASQGLQEVTAQPQYNRY